MDNLWEFYYIQTDRIGKIHLLMYVLVTQSCLTLCDPTDCSPLGSSVHGILQARILEWVAISSSDICSMSKRWNSIHCWWNRPIISKCNTEILFSHPFVSVQPQPLRQTFACCCPVSRLLFALLFVLRNFIPAYSFAKWFRIRFSKCEALVEY